MKYGIWQLEKAACDRPGAAIVILSDWRQLDGRLSCVDRAGKSIAPAFIKRPPRRVEHMTMNYCGRCGSANGATARFCRQCGADLSSQTAASSSAPPFNVEFSGKPVTKNLERETRPAPSGPESNQRIVAAHPRFRASDHRGHQTKHRPAKHRPDQRDHRAVDSGDDRR